MGKVVKTLAIVAIAVAVAVAAPYLAGFVATAGSSAFYAAAAVIGLGLSAAASALTQAISAAPGECATGRRFGYRTADPATFRMIEHPVEPHVAQPLAPIAPRSLWRTFFWPWQSSAIVRRAGDCMRGHPAGDARWIVVDRWAHIEPGDMFCFDTDDLWTSYRPVMRFAWLYRWTAIGMTKRYLGVDPARGAVVFDCTNPPQLCETGVQRIRYAYRVASWHRSWWSAWRAAVSTCLETV